MVAFSTTKPIKNNAIASYPMGITPMPLTVILKKVILHVKRNQGNLNDTIHAINFISFGLSVSWLTNVQMKAIGTTTRQMLNRYSDRFIFQSEKGKNPISGMLLPSNLLNAQMTDASNMIQSLFKSNGCSRCHQDYACRCIVGCIPMALN